MAQSSEIWSDERWELFDRLLEEEGLARSPRPGIPRHSDGDVPLSFPQRRLWFLERLYPGTPLYNIASAFRLLGTVDAAALAAALGTVVERHEVLRSAFPEAAGEPVQRVVPAASFSLPEIDLTALGNAAAAEAGRAVSEGARLPFDLLAPPLLRAFLFRLRSEEAHLLLSVHHIAADGWSIGVLLGELAALYPGKGASSPLPPLPIQYGDFAAWQRQRLEGGEGDLLAPSLAAWRSRLAGYSGFLDLPTDRPRPAVAGWRGWAIPFHLGPQVVAGLTGLARGEGGTLFMALLAVQAALFERISGQMDLVVGTPVAGRRPAEVEPLIGFFVNTLPLRLEVRPGEGLRALLAAALEVALEAFEHQDVPFERLVEEFAPERDASHAPLVQGVLTLESTPRPLPDLPGLRLEPLRTETGSAKFDWTLFLTEGADGGLYGALELRADLFDRATAVAALERLARLAAAAVAEPDRPLAELPLLSPAERTALLEEWNGGMAAREAAAATLSERFLAQAAERPDRVALIAVPAEVGEAAVSLTYGDLARQAGALAAELVALGVGPEVRVGVRAEPDAATLVGILGVVLAGGAYVPVDRNDPAARQAALLEDADVAAVLDARGFEAGLTRPGLPWLSPFVPLTAGAPAPAGLPALPDNVAYVLFTSGSTGRPKGVVVPHRNVDRLLAVGRGLFGFSEDDVWTLFHSPAFDFSVWEMWGAWAFGGRLVAVPRAVSRAPGRFSDLLADERVTVLNQTPSAFKLLVAVEQERERVDDLALRWIHFGGEALPPALLASWWERHPDGPGLANLYGITETVVHVTLRDLAPGDPVPEDGSRVGRALPHQRLYLGGSGLTLVPPGAPGEILVGGAGPARGYAGRPEATAERFVPDPWGAAPGARLYKSGDLARYRLRGPRGPRAGAPGDLEYLGRRDQQVKVRGFRIELGEVEAALLAVPGVTQAVVTARPGAQGTRLTAYYVPRPGADLPAAALRAAVARACPEPMVPTAWVRLPHLPLTVNGKVDRRALPEPDEARPEPGSAPTAPRTPTEEVLAQIWSEVLGVEAVGVHDDFFALGGDSILTIRVQSEAEKRGVGFPLDRVFTFRTVAELAAEVDSGRAVPVPRPVTAPFSLVAEEDRRRLPEGVEDAYPLTAVQAGMLYHMSYRPEEIVYHNVYSFHLKARYDPDAFRRAVARSVPRHPILRTAFDLNGYREPLQLVYREAEVPILCEDLADLPADEQERRLDAWVETEKRSPFDWRRPPLIRFALHKRGPDTLNFSLTECHPIFDGWSLHSFLAEILAACFAIQAGRELPEEPPLAATVRDFVALERAAVESEACRTYWQQALHGSAPPWQPRVRLPPEEGGAGEGRIRVTSVTLPAERFAALRALARRAAVPLKSVLLAVHARVLATATGSADVLSGVVVNGRPEVDDGERLLGLFFNVVPLRMAVLPGSWLDLVAATFAAEREMFPFRRYPLARLQQSRGGKPLFDVLFNYVHFHMLRDLFESGEVELLEDFRRFEETHLSLTATFLQDPLSRGIAVMLRYDRGEFDDAEIALLLGRYDRALAALVADPEAPHGEAPLLSEAERHQVATEWSGRGGESAPPASFLGLFAARAAEHPEAQALVGTRGEGLTYGELEAAADRLARLLRRAGVGTESRVGLALSRTPRAVMAILGVLKAGAAYVPFDLHHPRERLALLAERAGLAFLLTEEGAAGALPDLPFPTLALDGEEARVRLSAESAGPLGVRVPPESAAYVLFTSGSTGLPKAVVVEHRQLDHYLAGIIEALTTALPEGLGGLTFALVSTLAADLGHTVLFPALAAGGRLLVVDEDTAADGRELERRFAELGVDVLKIVPSHLAALLESGDRTRRLPRRCLVLGGEALPWPLAEEVAATAPGLAVFNHYGPTETTVGVAAGGLAPGLPLPAERWSATAPLGRPLAGAVLALLDAEDRPVPVGAVGELALGGGGVARGYLGRPDATAERFVPDPRGAPGARLYRSGDLARLLPDGRVEFLGRRDAQVKVRGFRVELGEVEAALHAHPGVAEAAVIADRDGAGEARLVAYVVARGLPAPTDFELRAALRRTLPDAMLPAVFSRLEALPRTANGKVDRRALPVLDPLLPTAFPRAAFVAPRNDLERRLAALWQEVMGNEAPGVEDDFFDLGGHSLVMLRLHGRLRESLGIDLPMTTLFDHPTIASLAEHLTSRGTPAASGTSEVDAAAVARGEARRALRPAARGRRQGERP